jgi:hypothetical protein
MGMEECRLSIIRDSFGYSAFHFDPAFFGGKGLNKVYYNFFVDLMYLPVTTFPPSPKEINEADFAMAENLEISHRYLSVTPYHFFMRTLAAYNYYAILFYIGSAKKDYKSILVPTVNIPFIQNFTFLLKNVLFQAALPVQELWSLYNTVSTCRIMGSLGGVKIPDLNKHENTAYQHYTAKWPHFSLYYKMMKRLERKAHDLLLFLTIISGAFQYAFAGPLIPNQFSPPDDATTWLDKHLFEEWVLDALYIVYNRSISRLCPEYRLYKALGKIEEAFQKKIPEEHIPGFLQNELQDFQNVNLHFMYKAILPYNVKENEDLYVIFKAARNLSIKLISEHARALNKLWRGVRRGNLSSKDQTDMCRSLRVPTSYLLKDGLHIMDKGYDAEFFLHLRVLTFMESMMNQMWLGRGLNCPFAMDQCDPADCGFVDLLERIWQKTELNPVFKGRKGYYWQKPSCLGS